MSASQVTLLWFPCLFGYEQTAHAEGISSKVAKRTVIVLTAKPRALLTLMNASEENNIADAAEKASRLLNTECEKIYSSMSMPRRFKFICILGPITDFEFAKTITHEWIRSRGSFPRTVCAQVLSRRYEIPFNIDIEAIYALNDLDVDVTILRNDTTGTTIEIRPR